MSGDPPQLVTITVKNLNEAPMITDGFTRNSQPEYDTDDPTTEGRRDYRSQGG